jgi:hypothetical protein
MLDALFVGLVVLDGFLTQKLLAIGGTELNPNPFVFWSADHLWARLIVAIVIILLLRFFDKWKLLIPACFLCLAICIYNAITLAVGNAAILSLAIFGK